MGALTGPEPLEIPRDTNGAISMIDTTANWAVFICVSIGLVDR